MTSCEPQPAPPATPEMLPPHAPPPARCPAQWLYERLAKSIMAFERKLDSEHEVGLRLVSFAPNESFHMTDMGYWEPDLIHFHGRNAAGEPVVLIQHISQVNVLLVATRKQQEKPQRIGFHIVKKLEAGEAGAPPPDMEISGG